VLGTARGERLSLRRLFNVVWPERLEVAADAAREEFG
jgi:hypothetical protein